MVSGFSFYSTGYRVFFPQEKSGHRSLEPCRHVGGGRFFHQMDIQAASDVWNIASFPLTTAIRPLVALPFFEAGVLLKRLVEKKNVDIVVGILSLIIWGMGVIYYRESADLSTLLLNNLLFYYLLAICGSCALIFISRYIVRMNRGPIHFVGINSLLYMFCNTIPNIMIIATLLHMESLVFIQFFSIMIVESLLVSFLIKYGSFVFDFDDLIKALQSINQT